MTALSCQHRKVTLLTESDTCTVSDNKPGEWPPPNPTEDIAKLDPNEKLIEETPIAAAISTRSTVLRLIPLATSTSTKTSKMVQ